MYYVISFLLLLLPAIDSGTGSWIESGAEIWSDSDENSWLELGLELERNGEYEEALEVWQSAQSELDIPSVAIANAYLRVVTEQRLEDYYPAAMAGYLWGYTHEEPEWVEKNREELEAEILRLEPLVGSDTRREWETLLENSDPHLSVEIRKYWEKMDPAPGRIYNARLLEHWERIAYAREQFDRSENPPYGTDDRGVYWVRYGEPDRNSSGHLQITRGDVMSVSWRLEQGFLTDGEDAPEASAEVMANAVFDLDQQPYYEVWTYDRPSQEMRDDLILIFGETAIGGFGRVETVEDFIPSRAFSMSTGRFDVPTLTGTRHVAGINLTPGMVMQWIYYRQLATVDNYFAMRFSQIETEWDSVDPDNPLGQHSGQMVAQRHRAEALQNMARAPSELSTYESVFPEITLEAHQYRLLDEQNRPVFVTFLESRPASAFLEDLVHNQDSMFDSEDINQELEDGYVLNHYRYVHGMQLRDEEWTLLAESTQDPPVVIDYDQEIPSSSLFVIPYVSGETTQVFYAELENMHPATSPRVETSFPQRLRGLGKIEVTQPEPLIAGPGELLASDLIFGYQMQADPPEGSFLPFVVSNDRRVPYNENLAVHFEVYQLEQDDEGIARFDVAYEIRPVEQRIFWTRRQEEQLSIRLNFEHDAPRFSESVEIQTQDLAPGDYELTWTVEDRQSGRSFEQIVPFEVRPMLERESQ